jgi:transglutaminase-like putative cysteine protease
MRIHIVHDVFYRYARPARGINQVLRMMPRDHDGQHVLAWRIEPGTESRLSLREDSFGNLVHSFSCDGQIDELAIHVEGEVETSDTAGVLRRSVERVPTLFYLRETDHTVADEALHRFALSMGARVRDDPLQTLHRVMGGVHGALKPQPASGERIPLASEAFAAGAGAAREFTHVFLSAARCLGIPARYVSGYFRQPDEVEQHAPHAWAEAFVPDLGWIGFDAFHKTSTTAAHVRVAIGLDYLGAAPIRGSRYGGGSEDISVKIRVDSARRQAQE